MRFETEYIFQKKFVAEGQRRGLATEQVQTLFNLLPLKIQNTKCSFDEMTKLWRYDFGEPIKLDNGSVLIGTNISIAIDSLFSVVLCASQRLNSEKQTAYFKRLGEPAKHRNVLVEFAPVLHLDHSISAEFEVSGRGMGNKTIDWVIGPHEKRTILIEVKRRELDLITHMNLIGSGKRGGGGRVPAPDHDPSLLFRSVEEKYLKADPDTHLQGVWISTDLKQETRSFEIAFQKLDRSNVHFAILGDFEPGVHILVRRSEDRQYLLKLLGLSQSERFVFTES